MARSTYVVRTFSLAHMRCVRTTREVCAVERSKGGNMYDLCDERRGGGGWLGSLFLLQSKARSEGREGLCGLKSPTPSPLTYMPTSRIHIRPPSTVWTHFDSVRRTFLRKKTALDLLITQAPFVPFFVQCMHGGAKKQFPPSFPSFFPLFAKMGGRDYAAE